MVAEFVRAFQEEANAMARTAAGQRGRELRRQLEGIERKVSGILTAIEDRMYSSVLKDRMRALERREAEIENMLASLERAPVVHLHPNISEVYCRKVADLDSVRVENHLCCLRAVLEAAKARIESTQLDWVLTNGI